MRKKKTLKMRLERWAIAKGFARGVRLTILLNAYDVLGTVEIELLCKRKDRILIEPGYMIEKQRLL